MAKSINYSLGKKKYTQISVKVQFSNSQKRLTLIEMVTLQGKSFSDIGRKLHLNASTVRLIYKKYEREGTIFNKKLKN